jgi:hypothetical protein
MRSSVGERERPGKPGEAAAWSAGGEQAAAVGGRRRPDAWGRGVSERERGRG